MPDGTGLAKRHLTLEGISAFLRLKENEKFYGSVSVEFRDGVPSRVHVQESIISDNHLYRCSEDSDDR